MTAGQPATAPATALAVEAFYPLPRPAEDPRFTFGLILDVGRVLAAAGYPPVSTGADHVRLQQALFGFLYAETDAP